MTSRIKRLEAALTPREERELTKLRKQWADLKEDSAALRHKRNAVSSALDVLFQAVQERLDFLDRLRR